MKEVPCFKAHSVSHESSRILLSWTGLWTVRPATYTLGERTSRLPGCGPLAGFTSLARALHFVTCFSCSDDVADGAIVITYGLGGLSSDRKLWTRLSSVGFTPSIDTLFLDWYTPLGAVENLDKLCDHLFDTSRRPFLNPYLEMINHAKR